MTEALHREDVEVGQTFTSGTATVEPDGIEAFAPAFDPQPLHLDEGAAAASPFGGPVASGWHTAARTMGLLVEGELRVAGGRLGARLEGPRWPRPVRPGDVLRSRREVRDLRPSRSRPDRGVVKVRSRTLNQDDQPVLERVANLIVPRRPA
jgi:acyl dehydratase